MMSLWRTTTFLIITCAAYGLPPAYAGDAPSREALAARQVESVTMPDLVNYTPVRALQHPRFWPPKQSF